MSIMSHLPRHIFKWQSQGTFHPVSQKAKSAPCLQLREWYLYFMGKEVESLASEENKSNGKNWVVIKSIYLSITYFCLSSLPRYKQLRIINNIQIHRQ